MAVAGLIALQPLTALASDTPTLEALRAILADPTSSDYVEVDQGTPNALVGPFDARTYADSFQTDSKTSDALVDSLNKEGFLAGYARSWYKPGTQIYMGAAVFAFHANAGARSALRASKLQYATGAGFKSFLDSSSIPQSFALTDSGPDGFNWTVVLFTKGNDMFAILAGSATGYTSADALTQAKAEYVFAPASTFAGTPAVLAAGHAFGKALLVSLVLMAMLVAAVVGSILVVLNARKPSKPVLPGSPR